MKEKFLKIYPILNLIIIICAMRLEGLWILVFLLSSIALAISLKDNADSKASTKIFAVSVIILTCVFIIYKLFKMF